MEGPSVHFIADELQGLIGQEIERVGGNAKQPKEELVGREIEDVRSVKKRLFLDTGRISAVIHFLMYGSYELNQFREDLDERLSLKCSGDEINFYSCSAKILERDDSEFREYDDPEADILSEEFDAERAVKVLSDKESPVVDVLLNQDVFGGVGNIIKNEVLFKTKIHPGTIAREIPEEKTKELVNEAIDWPKSWYRNKKKGKDTEFRIYRQGTCDECGSNIIQQKMGESDRITFFCPDCQKMY